MSDASAAMMINFAAMLGSLALASYALETPTLKHHLGQGLSLIGALMMGAAWLWSRSKWGKQAAAKVAALPKTVRQREEQRRALIITTVNYIFFCAPFGYVACDWLFDSPLGVGYKALLVGALNGLGYTLTRAVPVVFAHIKREKAAIAEAKRAPAPVAATGSVVAPAASATLANVGSAVTTGSAPHAAPLTLGRNQQTP